MSGQLEPWLDKKAAAQFWACSERSIDYAIRDGMPHAIIFGKLKFRVSEVEPWLVARSRLERRGEQVYAGSDIGAAPDDTGPAPGHEG
jgi:hypothetical protein